MLVWSFLLLLFFSCLGRRVTSFAPIVVRVSPPPPTTTTSSSTTELSPSSPINWNKRHGITSLKLARWTAAPLRESLAVHWFPVEHFDADSKALVEQSREYQMHLSSIEETSIILLAALIKERLAIVHDEELTAKDQETERKVHPAAAGSFLDLASTSHGEHVLESLFTYEELLPTSDMIVHGAVAALHSLLIMGMQLGMKGSPDQLERFVAHLKGSGDEEDSDDRKSKSWSAAKTRRLKYVLDRTAGVQVLAALIRKRTPQGALDLLVEIGAWTKHENLPLLRSGLPLRFSPQELSASESAKESKYDPDELLGIRQDLRHHKIYTVDGASTREIDDGLSLEVIQNSDGSTKQRIWIHIADAERWIPLDSPLFKVAQQRATSVYLPDGSLSMLPDVLSVETMSLRANEDVCALSLGVELRDDGSIIDSSLVVTPSCVNISYRLTYDEVDEMLEEGIAYNEEWEIGALLDAAKKRRLFRIANGSSEGFIPNQMPQYHVSTFVDEQAPDGIGIDMKVQVSHNGGVNQSSVLSLDPINSHIIPLSSSSVMVTELMILGGEAIGKWKLHMEKEQSLPSPESTISGTIENKLRLPFRTQPARDYRSRPREKGIMMDLLEHNIGKGYCHAFYARRFFSPVKVKEIASQHAGLGLACYVQWSSPIRRISDLQAHAAVKRYLRRNKVNEIMANNGTLPATLTASALGCSSLPTRIEGEGYTWDGGDEFDYDIDYQECNAMMGAARHASRSSNMYWLLEYVRRQIKENPDKVYETLVLGCTDPNRRQYAIYFYELGFEYRFVNPLGDLDPGFLLKVYITSVSPRSGQLILARADV